MGEERPTIDDIVADRLPALSSAEARVAVLFRDQREEVLLLSAAALAARAGTSDATVIRTARALGFGGMGDLRRRIAEGARRGLSPADRLVATLGEVGKDAGHALDATLDVHAEALDAIRRDMPRRDFARAVGLLAEASRVVAFGLGPTGCIADYLAFQLERFGLAARAMTRTGLLAADDLASLRRGDGLIVMAYGPPHTELAVLLDEAERLGLRSLLVTDAPLPESRRRFDIVLTVPRGRADRLSLHAGTLALVEALLVGIAARRPDETLSGLDRLDGLRKRLAGLSPDLTTDGGTRRPR